jgi:biofilm protein TabA
VGGKEADMILDRLENADRYTVLHPVFARALAFLRQTDLPALAAGRHEIDGERLFAMVVKGQGKGRDKAPIEIHRKYIDIQYTLAGGEVIGWKDAGACRQAKAFDEAKDVGFFDDAPEAWIDVPPGALAVFFPHDAHAPMAGAGEVVKVVVKVRV